jgi:hypothetical protein
MSKTQNGTQIATTCFLGVLVVVLIRILIRILDSERERNRVLLGFPDQTPPSRPLQSSVTWPEPGSDPLAELEDLSPEIRDTLMREYQEHLSQYPKNIRENPEVPVVIPGQTVALS